jgi:hypothetical protein
MDEQASLLFTICVAEAGDLDKTCCVCFLDKLVLGLYENGVHRDATLSEIEPTHFIDNVIPDDVMFIGPCGVHYLCVHCLRTIIHNYDNHPINENNSHFSCPYPFEECLTDIGFKNIYDHNLIHKVCRNSQEWETYLQYTAQYAFPGYTSLKCPFTVDNEPCNSAILINLESLRASNIGDLIAECNQNPDCMQRFCYYCKTSVGRYSMTCYKCRLTFENENPNLYNYYFNKSTENPLSCSLAETEFTSLTYDEDDYLYVNKDLTASIATQCILNLVSNASTHIICPICKAGLFKTEKCNTLTHHGVDRCYACARIGFKLRGLPGEHWNTNGVEGCFRYNTDDLILHHVPLYKCTEYDCSNHDIGDCYKTEHQLGIEDLDFLRKKAQVFHMLKSLLKDVRYVVYDSLVEKSVDNQELLQLLPFKQTLVLLDTFKERSRDYLEEIVYQQLHCLHPQDVQSFINKNITVEAQDYVLSHQAPVRLQTRDEPLLQDDTLSDDTRHLIEVLYRYTEVDDTSSNDSSHIDTSSNSAF